jgi:hypothetical protein
MQSITVNEHQITAHNTPSIVGIKCATEGRVAVA